MVSYWTPYDVIRNVINQMKRFKTCEDMNAILCACARARARATKTSMVMVIDDYYY